MEGGKEMICPMIEGNPHDAKVDDIYSSWRECLKEKCAWWVENDRPQVSHEKPKKSGECAIVRIASLM